MRKELIFNNGYNNYNVNKYYFQNDKKTLNINEVDINKIFLSDKAVGINGTSGTIWVKISTFLTT